MALARPNTITIRHETDRRFDREVTVPAFLIDVDQAIKLAEELRAAAMAVKSGKPA
jgi:hypothetical protein